MRISDWSSDVCSSDLLRWGVDADTDIILDGRFVDRVYVDDSTDESAPGYAVFDLAAARRFEAFGLQWRGYARIANLFDREYVGSVRVKDGTGRYYEPAPGRGRGSGLRGRKTFGCSSAGWGCVPPDRAGARLPRI